MDLILIIIPLILIFISNAYINNSYKKYSVYEVKSGKTGYETAREILDTNGLENVKIQKVSGTLTDNFNPKTNTISLSKDVYDDSSVASVAVAAHECGHVMQHKEKYAFIVLRGILVPVVNLTSRAGYIIMIIGCIASILDVAMIGLILMAGSLVFQLITLPTEFNASKRARKQLLKLNIINESELSEVGSMLNSSAMTYVASFFASLAQMLRLFLNLRRND